jgi:antitoxin ParD1/3/4
MSGNTMSFALPESMRAYIDERVRSGQYGNTSEYIRDLVRRDQEAQARRRMQELITAGLSSGEGRRLDRRTEAELRVRALGLLADAQDVAGILEKQ